VYLKQAVSGETSRQTFLFAFAVPGVSLLILIGKPPHRITAADISATRLSMK
jgi:hypothetical protein